MAGFTDWSNHHKNDWIHMKSLLHSIQRYMMRTEFLVFGSIFVSLPIICCSQTLWFDILKHTESEKGTEIYQLLVMALVTLLMTCSSIIIIVRKENPMPNKPSVKGTPAVIIGVIGSVFFGSFALYALYEVIFLLLAH